VSHLSPLLSLFLNAFFFFLNIGLYLLLSLDLRNLQCSMPTSEIINRTSKNGYFVDSIVLGV